MGMRTGWQELLWAALCLRRKAFVIQPSRGAKPELRCLLRDTCTVNYADRCIEMLEMWLLMVSSGARISKHKRLLRVWQHNVTISQLS
jgi:hypothetical protein